MEEDQLTPNTWAEAFANAAPVMPLDMASMDRAVLEMKEAREKYDAQKKISDALYTAFEEKKAVLLAMMKQGGKEKYHVAGLGTAYIINKWQVRMPKLIEEKKKLFKVLADEKVFFEFLSVNHNTLNGWYNEKVEAAIQAGLPGVDVPGLAAPTHEEMIGFRKG